MKVSSKGRYALRLMIDLASRTPGSWITLKEIAENQEISLKYLEHIVNKLYKAGLLASLRGPHGGYHLTRSAEEYTVGEVLRAVEGELSPVPCLEWEEQGCERRDECKSFGFWLGLYQCVNDYVDSVKLCDLLEEHACFLEN